MKCYGACKCLTAEAMNAGTHPWANDAIIETGTLGGVASVVIALTPALLAPTKTGNMYADNDCHFQED